VALALEEGAAFVADYGNPYARDDDVERDYEQMLAQFGVRYRPDLLHGGSNLGFSELAEKALSALGHQPLPPDLLIVTYAVPGAPLIKVTAAHLNRLMGNTACSFAICEQGSRAPFTALHVSRAFAQEGRCARLALVILEPTTLPHWEPIVHDTPLVDSGVVLVFGEHGTLALAEVCLLKSEDTLVGCLSRIVQESPGEQVLAVAGPWVDPSELAVPGLRSHRAPPGSYCTGAWIELARRWSDWSAHFDVILVCDRDPQSRRSHLAVFRSCRAASLPEPLKRTA